MSTQPWMKFFPSDWRSEVTLRCVSREARSLWVDILCLIHEGGDGRLHFGGAIPTDKMLASVLGDNPRTIRKLMSELELAGVYSRNEQGFIISRRIIRDLEKAEKDKSNGRMGGNPSLKNKDLDENGVNPSVKAHIPEAIFQKPEARKITPKAPQTVDPVTTPVEPVADAEPAGLAERELIDLKTGITAAFREAGSMTLAPDTHRAATWLAQGHKPAIILATIREILARKPNVKTLSYFDNPIREAHEMAAKAPVGAAQPMDEGKRLNALRGLVERWQKSPGSWPQGLGPQPDQPGTPIPGNILAEFGITPANRRAA